MRIAGRPAALAATLSVTCLVLGAGCAAAGNGATAAAEPAEPPPYSVECSVDAETGGSVCLVDKQTYIGWRTYHAFCHVCHAQNAVGSTFAPSLVERLTLIDKERFMFAVAEGYTGQVGVMPGWKENPNISKRYEELYAYLKARSDGVLKPGRPKRKKEAPAQ